MIAKGIFVFKDHVAPYLPVEEERKIA